MPISNEHEVLKRRFRRNLALGGVLLLFVVLVFFMTMAKIRQGSLMEAFDHTYRASLGPLDGSRSSTENDSRMKGEGEGPAAETGR